MAEQKTFLSASDVAELTGCSLSKSYCIIRQLNAELTEKGFLVFSGKVSAKYFYERFYDGKEVLSK